MADKKASSSRLPSLKWQQFCNFLKETSDCRDGDEAGSSSNPGPSSSVIMNMLKQSNPSIYKDVEGEKLKGLDDVMQKVEGSCLAKIIEMYESFKLQTSVQVMSTCRVNLTRISDSFIEAHKAGTSKKGGTPKKSQVKGNDKSSKSPRIAGRKTPRLIEETSIAKSASSSQKKSQTKGNDKNKKSPAVEAKKTPIVKVERVQTESVSGDGDSSNTEEMGRGRRKKIAKVKFEFPDEEPVSPLSKLIATPKQSAVSKQDSSGKKKQSTPYPNKKQNASSPSKKQGTPHVNKSTEESRKRKMDGTPEKGHNKRLKGTPTSTKFVPKGKTPTLSDTPKGGKKALQKKIMKIKTEPEDDQEKEQSKKNNVDSTEDVDMDDLPLKQVQVSIAKSKNDSSFVIEREGAEGNQKEQSPSKDVKRKRSATKQDDPDFVFEFNEDDDNEIPEEADNGNKEDSKSDQTKGEGEGSSVKKRRGRGKQKAPRKLPWNMVPIICSKCRTRYSSYTALRSHWNRRHSTDGEHLLLCAVCDVTFDCARTYFKHFREHVSFNGWDGNDLSAGGDKSAASQGTGQQPKSGEEGTTKLDDVDDADGNLSVLEKASLGADENKPTSDNKIQLKKERKKRKEGGRGKQKSARKLPWNMVPIVCSVCMVRYSTYSTLRRHWETTHSRSAKIRAVLHAESEKAKLAAQGVKIEQAPQGVKIEQVPQNTEETLNIVFGESGLQDTKTEVSSETVNTEVGSQAATTEVESLATDVDGAPQSTNLEGGSITYNTEPSSENDKAEGVSPDVETEASSKNAKAEVDSLAVDAEASSINASTESGTQANNIDGSSENAIVEIVPEASERETTSEEMQSQSAGVESEATNNEASSISASIEGSTQANNTDGSSENIIAEVVPADSEREMPSQSAVVGSEATTTEPDSQAAIANPSDSQAADLESQTDSTSLINADGAGIKILVSEPETAKDDSERNLSIDAIDSELLKSDPDLKSDELDSKLIKSENPDEPPPRMMLCPVCHLTFDSPRVFFKHFRQHVESGEVILPSSTDPTTRDSSGKTIVPPHANCYGERTDFECDKLAPITCAICLEVMPGEGLIYNHWKTWHKEGKEKKPPPLFHCDQCKQVFDAPRKFKLHYRTHTGARPHECDICARKFRTFNDLNCHMLCHSQDKTYKCHICDKAFNAQKILNRHIKGHLEPSVCETCGKSYPTKYSLRLHMKIHTGEKPYKCDICGVSFTQAGSLKLHRRLHLGEKPHICNVCGMRFNSQTHLRTHMRVHTGEKPYKCNLCNYAAASSSRLRDHATVHRSDKPHVCKVPGCGRRYKRLSHLIFHHSKHPGIKPYVCTRCGAAFKLSSMLSLHKRQDACLLKLQEGITVPHIKEEADFELAPEHAVVSAGVGAKHEALSYQVLVSTKPDSGPSLTDAEASTIMAGLSTESSVAVQVDDDAFPDEARGAHETVTYIYDNGELVEGDKIAGVQAVKEETKDGETVTYIYHTGDAAHLDASAVKEADKEGEQETVTYIYDDGTPVDASQLSQLQSQLQGQLQGQLQVGTDVVGEFVDGASTSLPQIQVVDGASAEMEPSTISVSETGADGEQYEHQIVIQIVREPGMEDDDLVLSKEELEKIVRLSQQMS